MNGALLLAGLSMGFLGSPHCLGMCGGIVSAFGISMQGVSDTKKAMLIGVYHVGRLISYMVLGAVASSVGMAIFAPLIENKAIPRIVVGVALVFVALLMLGLPMLTHLEKLGLKLWQVLSPIRSKLFPLITFPKALGAGFLWGFLPCGMVYGAVAIAIGAGTAGGSWASNAGFGALFMMVFGLGTIPMLIATQSVVIWLQTHIKKFSLRQVSGVIMLLSGLAVAVPPLMHSNQVHGSHQMSHDHSTMNHAMTNHSMANHSMTNHSMDTPNATSHDMTNHDMANHDMTNHTMDNATSHTSQDAHAHH